LFGLHDSKFLEYGYAKDSAFEGRNYTQFRNFPTFNGDMDLKEIWTNHCLKSEGVEKIKQMMWVINKTNAKLEFCPIFIPVTSMLMVTFDECQTFNILSMLLDKSYKLLNEDGQVNRAEKLRAVRWWFTFSDDDWVKTCHSFWDLMRVKSDSVAAAEKFIQKKGPEWGSSPDQVISYLFGSFFMTVLPYDLVYHMFMVYLNEGIKILFRMGYAFFKMFKEELTTALTLEQMNLAVGHKTANFTQLDKKVFIQLCFRPSLQRIKQSFSAIQLTDQFQTNKQEIYKPIPDTSSKIIEDDVFEDIYKWLPQTFRASDPKLLYANWRDGTSLKT